MALIKNKKTFIKAVSTIVGVDMGVQNDLFPKARPRRTKLIEFDFTTVENALPEYNSFSNTANVVSKDGKDRIILGAMNFNESISKDTIDADAEKFGENEYGDGRVDPVTESALNGVAKLEKRALVGTKKAIYEALTTFKIVNGYQGSEGVEDIVFPVPATNKKVVGTKWDDANAKPLDDIYSLYKAMLVKPTKIIMHPDTYAKFEDNAQVLTVDNTSNGTLRNYWVNEKADASKKYFKAGRIVYRGMRLDVMIEQDTYKNSSGVDTYYLDPKFVVFASNGNGTTEFGGIPVAKKGVGVVNIAAEKDVEEIIESNPPQHMIVYRTAPLPLLKNGNAFGSLQVLA